MRNPENVLKSLSENALKTEYRYERLYRNLYNPEFYLLAYQNIATSQGSMTAGEDGRTLDGMSMEHIESIIAKLKDHSYQPNPAKQKFISQIMTSKSPARVCEDVDELVLTYSEMQAITSGNPYIKEKIELDNEISRLRLLESEHSKERFALQELVEKKLPKDIESYMILSEKAKQDVEFLKTNLTEEFSIKLDDIVYNERKDAGAVLDKEIQQCLIAGETRFLGEYMGFKVVLEKDPTVFQNEYRISLQHQLHYTTAVERDNALGNIIRMENLCQHSCYEKADSFSLQLKKAQEDLLEAQANVNTPFVLAGELKQKEARRAYVLEQLELDKAEDVYMDESSEKNDTITDEVDSEYEMET